MRLRPCLLFGALTGATGCFTFISFDDQGAGGATSGTGATGSEATTSVGTTNSPSASMSSSTGSGGEGGAVPCAYHELIAADAPVAWWSFEEEPGSQAVTSNDGNRTSLLSPGQTIGVAAVVNCPSTRSIRLEGNSPLAFSSAGLAFQPNEAATFEAWVMRDDPSGTLDPISIRDASTDPGWLLRLTANGGGTFRRFNASGNESVFYSLAAIDPVHIVGRYDPTAHQICVFLNAQKGCITTTDEQLPLISANLRFGGLFQGQLDEVAIYARALDDAEILAHYNAGKPP